MKIINLQTTTHTDVITQAKQVLASGGLVVFPTETCYGIGADATNPKAVEKLIAYKRRREGKPLSIAVTDLQMAEKFVEVNESARKIYQRLLPGPITVVSKSLGNVAAGVESEFGTLGVRISSYNLVGELVSALSNPITATSANASGKRTPYTINHILDNISNKQRDLIDLILDAGELPKNPPSTVIDTTLSTPVTLRQGLHHQNSDKSQNIKTQTEAETKQLAGKLLMKNWDTVNSNGLIITLDGPLGAGKTIFAKGIAEFLDIQEDITSPTYTYIEEYKYTRHQTTGQFFHLDLWKVETEDQLKLLDLPSMFANNNIIAIEWWENVAHLPIVREWINNGILPPQLNIAIADPNQNNLREIQVTDPTPNPTTEQESSD